MKKALFIYCPYSGENKIVGCLDYIFKRYNAAGIALSVYRFTDQNSVEEALATVDESTHHILVAGGDGTINRVVTAMMRMNVHVPLATLPAGTANDFARLLGYSGGIKSSCDKILSGRIVNVDLGKANDHYFVNVLSAGLFTEVSQKTPTILKNTFGKLAYYMGGVHELPRFRKMGLRVMGDHGVFEETALIFFVFNGKTAGNMPIAYRSHVNDGLLDVLIVKGDNLGEAIQTAFHFLTGSRRQYPKGVVHFKTNRLRVEVDMPLSVDLDGEHGPEAPLEIVCVEKALQVIVPDKV